MKFPICWNFTFDGIGFDGIGPACPEESLEDSREDLAMLEAEKARKTAEEMAKKARLDLNLALTKKDKTISGQEAQITDLQGRINALTSRPVTLTLSTITDVQTPPSVIPPPSSPVLRMSAILSTNIAPSPPATRSASSTSNATSIHRTPCAPSPKPFANLQQTSNKRVQAIPEESGGVKEGIDPGDESIAALKKREDHDDGREKVGGEAWEDEKKEGRRKEEVNECSMSESGDIVENDGLDGSSTLGERKGKDTRQHAKRGLARQAAQEAARKAVSEAAGAAWSASQEDMEAGEDTKGEGKEAQLDGGASHEYSNEGTDLEADRTDDVNNANELEAQNSPDNGPGGAPEGSKKKTRRRKRGKARGKGPNS